MDARESDKSPAARVDAELVYPDYIRTNTDVTLTVYNSCNNHGREERTQHQAGAFDAAKRHYASTSGSCLYWCPFPVCRSYLLENNTTGIYCKLRPEGYAAGGQLTHHRCGYHYWYTAKSLPSVRWSSRKLHALLNLIHLQTYERGGD